MFGSEVVTAFRNWRKREQVRRELYGLSERQLADIGLNPGDIEAVARGIYRGRRSDRRVS